LLPFYDTHQTLTMKKLSLLSTIAAVLLFSSCQKNNIEPEPKPKEDIFTWLAKVKDSCSYTIDGKVYTCDHIGGTGWANRGTNLDTSNGQWKWHPDSLLYSTEFRFYSSSISDHAYFELQFAKKYGKNQLAPKIGTMLAPPTNMDLYGMGLHKFAVEFERFNNDEGVVLTMDKLTGSSIERLSTISNYPVPMPTTIGPQSHNDSEFEIVKVQPLPYGYDGYIIEAWFSANVFDKQEQAKRVEGYVRLRVKSSASGFPL